MDIKNTQNKTEKKSDGREIVYDKERFFRPVECHINFQEKEYRNTNGNCMIKQLNNQLKHNQRSSSFDEVKNVI